MIKHAQGSRFTLIYMEDEKKLVGTPHPGSEKKEPKQLIRGRVHAYSYAVKSGVIVADNREYLFSRKDWLSEQIPVVDLLVLFTPQGNWARAIKVDG